MVIRLKELISLFAAVLLLVLGFGLTKISYQYFYNAAYPMKYQEYVSHYAKEYDVPPSLVYAVIRSESSFDPDAVSNIGARGLMQITESTYEWAVYRMGTSNPLDYDSLWEPEENIRYGVYILSLLLKEFDSPETALCAYHAGWGNVKSWLENEEYSADGVNIHSIPFKDTGRYVPKVMETKAMYEKLYQL